MLFYSQGFTQQIVDKQKLSLLSHTLTLQNEQNYKAAIDSVFRKNWRLIGNRSNTVLKGTDPLGFPMYFKIFSNVISAATTQTNTVQPGGALNLNLSGSSSIMANKLAVWDEGIPYTNHTEFAGKAINIPDGATNVSSHTTHVTGTMIAAGKYAPAKGMAFGATSIQAYDFNNDGAEMADAAAKGLLISNHSYGYDAGWSMNTDQNRWEWLGLPGDTVDYKFGFYGNEAKTYDEIAFNAPQYLIVQAVGNNREDIGPPVGGSYYGYASKADPSIVSKGARPGNISSNNSYDAISTSANAKNILTVGAVYPLPSGPTATSIIKIAPFSSWGPTDDGRIKPDICGNGMSVLSTGSSSPDSYFILSGTSMSTANVSGSLLLLQEYYAQKTSGSFMRSATLKGLICNTAIDAGNPGPDYIYGWGLLDMRNAAQTITDNGYKSLIKEQTLLSGESQKFVVTANGNEDLKITICWTDAAGEPSVYGTINDRTPKLINDLDLRVNNASNNYMPWVLDPEAPSANAKTGDNMRDNIEQIIVTKPKSGEDYTIMVSHKKHLLYGIQNYSLIVNGIQGVKFNANTTTGNELVSVFPVPCNNNLNVVVNPQAAAILYVTLYDSLGKSFYNQTEHLPEGAHVTNINTNKFPTGAYYLKVQLDAKIYYRKVLVVK